MNNQLRGYATVDQRITINYQNSSIVLSVITPEIIRVFQDHGEKGTSYAIEGNKTIKTNFTVLDHGDHLELTTAALIVKIYDNEKIDVYDKDGHPLIIDYQGERTPIDRGLDEAHAKLVAAEGHDIAFLELNCQRNPSLPFCVEVIVLEKGSCHGKLGPEKKVRVPSVNFNIPDVDGLKFC